MKIEGHLSNDYQRFDEGYPEIHKDLDKYFKTPEFCGTPIHTLEYVLEKYTNKEWTVVQVRAAIHHLLDDFGNNIPLAEDWKNPDHWLGDHCK